MLAHSLTLDDADSLLGDDASTAELPAPSPAESSEHIMRLAPAVVAPSTPPPTPTPMRTPAAATPLTSPRRQPSTGRARASAAITSKNWSDFPPSEIKPKPDGTICIPKCVYEHLERLHDFVHSGKASAARPAAVAAVARRAALVAALPTDTKPAERLACVWSSKTLVLDNDLCVMRYPNGEVLWGLPISGGQGNPRPDSLYVYTADHMLENARVREAARHWLRTGDDCELGDDMPLPWHIKEALRLRDANDIDNEGDNSAASIDYNLIDANPTPVRAHTNGCRARDHDDDGDDRAIGGSADPATSELEDSEQSGDDVDEDEDASSADPERLDVADLSLSDDRSMSDADTGDDEDDDFDEDEAVSTSDEDADADEESGESAASSASSASSSSVAPKKQAAREPPRARAPPKRQRVAEAAHVLIRPFAAQLAIEKLEAEFAERQRRSLYHKLHARRERHAAQIAMADVELAKAGFAPGALE
jgi:hypothetical protein